MDRTHPGKKPRFYFPTSLTNADFIPYLYPVCKFVYFVACERAPKWGMGRRQNLSHPHTALRSPGSPIFLFALYPTWKPAHRLPILFHLSDNLVPSGVLRLFDQRLVVRRDSGELEKIKVFDWLPRRRLALFYRRNPAVIKFQFPRVSPGAHPLTKKPDYSRNEIAFHLKVKLH